jgi:membrane protein
VPRRSLLRRLSGQIWQACQRWNNAECVDLSAAFAYFVLQSFFPLLLIALSVAARVFGKTDSVDNVLASVTQVLPPSAISLVDSTCVAWSIKALGLEFSALLFYSSQLVMPI